MNRRQIVNTILPLFIIVILSCNSKDTFPVLKGPYLGQKPPGIMPEVFAPGIISHGFHEHNLTISPDGDEMFFTTSSGDHKHYAIIYVQRKNNIWAKPEIASFSGNHSDMGPRFSSDGKKVYFCSKRPVPGSMEENSNYDLWVID
ncbi:MAG: PD40 domain-containing protein, partial [bacterium]